MIQEDRTHTSSTVKEKTEPEIAWHNLRVVVSKIMIPKDVHAPILRTCDYVTLHRKWDLDKIKVKDPEMGRLT